MFLVNRTLRPFSTGAFRPFSTRAFRPPPISQPWAYHAGKCFFHSEFSKAGPGIENTPRPKSLQVGPCIGKKVGEDKADVHSQVKDPGGIYKRVAILLPMQDHVLVKLLANIEQNMKEMKLDLKEEIRGSRKDIKNLMILAIVALWGMAAIKVFYFDPKAPRETEGRLQSVRSDGQANLVADMRETREPIKALGTPAPRRWLF